MNGELVGRTGLARILEVSEATTRNWEARGLIEPACRIDGRDLFSAEKARELKAARTAQRPVEGIGVNVRGGKAYRADLRGDTSRGLTGRQESVGPNPRVSSKNVKRYGVDGSRLPDATHRSTGTQPAPLHRGAELPGALPARDRQAGTPSSERVGYQADGSYKAPTFPNTGRHFQGAPVVTRTSGAGKLDQASYLLPTRRGPATN